MDNNKTGGVMSILLSLSMDIRQNNPVKNEDYVSESGFLMCGFCNTPKEKMVDFNDKGKKTSLKMPVSCSCAWEKFEHEQERIRQSKIEELRRRFIPDDTYRQHRFEKDDSPEDVNSVISKKYAAKWEEMLRTGKGLLFTGTVGMGKSFYACCIANAVVDKGDGAMVTTIARVKAKLDNFNTKISVLDDIAGVPLLVLDDFGTESTTSTSLEHTNTIIDTRYKSGKPLIVTTNLTLEQMQDSDKVPPRMADRILEMCPIQLVFVGKSKRQNIAERSRQEMYKLLSE